MCCLEVQKFCHKCDLKKSQKQFFISNTIPEQSVLAGITVLPSFSLSQVFPKIFMSSGDNSSSPSINPRFKMILWSIIAGTRGGVNRAKILNLIKDTPLNAHKISTILNLDHKTVSHQNSNKKRTRKKSRKRLWCRIPIIRFNERESEYVK